MSVGEDNAGHFFVGTQDKQLRSGISKVPAGASMFMSVNGLHLEQPSAKQEKVIHQVSQQSQHFMFCPAVFGYVVTLLLANVMILAG